MVSIIILFYFRSTAATWKLRTTANPTLEVCKNHFEKGNAHAWKARYFLQYYGDLKHSFSKVLLFMFINVLCDLVFEDNLNAHRTKFFQFWQIEPLMLKYWTDVYGIIKKNGKICSYALCLIIFYVQRIRVLPTLVKLKKDCILIVNDRKLLASEF